MQTFSFFRHTKRERFLDILAILRAFPLHFPKPLGWAPYFTPREILLDTVSWNQAWSHIPKPFLSYVNIFFLVWRILETLRSRSKGITWKIFFMKNWHLSWRKLTDFFRCGLKQNNLKKTRWLPSMKDHKCSISLKLLRTFKCFVTSHVWKPYLDDMRFQKTCF